MVPLTLSELEETACKVRKDIIEMIYRAGSGHPGGSLSSVEILVALFFGGVLNFDKKDFKNEKRDRFILSCGHICPSYYSVLANLGFFNEDLLSSLRDLSSSLQGHPSSVFADFVETSTGSLGQGLSVGVGMAMGLKLKVQSSKCKIVVLSSDGEQNEGSHWEAVASGAFHELGNLCLIIDKNKMQIGGETKKVLEMDPLIDKYKAFGWDAYEIEGHDYRELLSFFSRFNETKESPKVVICRTIRGKGVSFMEGNEKYHECTLSEDEYKRAMEELS